MPTSAQVGDLWQKAVEYVRSRSPATFEQWFSSVQFDGLEAGVLTLTARDEFVRDWVKAHFLPDLVTQLGSSLGDAVEALKVEWRVSTEIASPVCESKPRPPTRSRPPSSAPRAADRSSAASRAALLAQLNPKHTFSNFVVGPSNELAYAAAFASAGGGGPRYNPLFIAGGTGLGKTHLMHAIAHKVLEERPDARVIYVSAERFTNEIIEALQQHKMDEFSARLRTVCSLG